MQYDCDIDNRDIQTTRLNLAETEDYIEVNPWELVKNAIENIGLPAYQEAKLLDKIEEIRIEAIELQEKYV